VSATPFDRLRAIPLWLRVSGALVVALLILVQVVLPALVSSAIEDALLARGATAVSIGHVDVQPLSGRVRISALAASDGERELSVDRIEVNLAWMALFDDRILLETLEVEGVEGAIVLSDESLTVGPLEIQLTPAGAVDAPSTGQAATQFGVDSLAVSDADLRLSYRGQTFPAAVRELRIGPFATWDPGAATALLLDLTLAGATVGLEGESRPLMPGHPSSASVRIAGLDLAPYRPLLPERYASADGRIVNLDGDLHVSLPADGPALRFDGTVVAEGVALPLGGAARASLQHAEWSGRIELDPQAGALMVAGEFGAVSADAQLPELQVSVARAAWNGDARLRMADGLVADAAGQVELDTLALTRGGADPMTLRVGSLRAENRFTEEALKDSDEPWPVHLRRAGEELRLAATGHTRIEAASGDFGDHHLRSLDSLVWDGGIALELDDVGLSISDEGGLAIDGLRASDDARGLELSLGGLHWQGASSFSADAGHGLSLAGDAHLVDLDATRSDGSGRVVAVGTADLIGARITDGGGHALASLAVTGTTLGEPSSGDAALLRLATLTVDGMQTVDGELRIGATVLDGLRISLVTHADGSVPALAVLSGPGAGATSATAARDDTPGPIRSFRMQDLRVTGASGIHINDPSVPGGFAIDAAFERLSISDASQGDVARAQLDMLLRVDEYQTVSAQGPIGMDDGELVLDLVVDLTSIELPPLSQYSARSVAHYLYAGNLDAHAQVKLAQRQLDIDSDIIMHGPEVERLSDEEAASLGADTSVPLLFGLSLLRDNDGNVELEVPVHGSLDDPDFDTSDAAWSAVRSALASGASTYFKLALGPFGAALVIGDMLSGGRVNMEPVLFAPGSSAAPADLTAYVASIAGLMAERPDVQLRVCGFAVPADAPVPGAVAPATPAVDPLVLARDRATLIRRMLVETHGMDASRVLVCRPQADAAASAQPRAELSF